jgi:hypothetical protein
MLFGGCYHILENEMKYNLNNIIDQKRFKDRCNELYKESAFVELKKVNLDRSIPQNSYLHLILSWFAIEYGETMDYVKEEIFKKQVNKDIFMSEFVNRKTGEVRPILRSTKVLDTKEMTIAIDRFRDFSSKEAGIYLPQPNEKEYLKQVQIEMERMKNYI